MTTTNALTIFRGHFFHTSAQVDTNSVELHSQTDGALVVDNSGTIVAVGDFTALKATYATANVVSFGDRFIIPGFVDAHVHFPQMGMIGSWGEHLLNWLDRYTYVEEQKFADNSYAEKWAARFVDAALANGTTAAAIFSSNHTGATDILFAESNRRGLRAVIGKTSMDQNAPAALCRGPEQDAIDQEFLLKKWHKPEFRTSFSINPRFAISCSESLLKGLGDLKKSVSNAFVQTHFAETLDEIETVKKIFPKSKNYLSVYDEFGLLSERTILGHGIHPNSDELALLSKRKSTIVHCPTSNNFLGSGFCRVPELRNANHHVCLGTDIGAGTSFSMFSTMREAYYIQKQSGNTLTPATLLHLATWEGARLLNRLESKSCFAVGAPADFVVLDWSRSNVLKQRLENSNTDDDRLFATIILGDDRIVDSTYIGGIKAHALA